MVNCYLLWNENKEAYIFDCGGEDLEQIFTTIENNGLTLKYIVLTHGHGDHIEGLNKLKKYYLEAKVYVGVEEKDFLIKDELNLMNFINGRKFIYSGDYTTVKEGDTVGDFVVIDTPGHTAGSKCFYNKENEILISGDTMFRRSYGRYDLPTGNGYVLFDSLRKLCKTLPTTTKVYSGHSEVTTIGEEIEFLKIEGII